MPVEVPSPRGYLVVVAAVRWAGTQALEVQRPVWTSDVGSGVTRLIPPAWKAFHKRDYRNTLASLAYR